MNRSRVVVHLIRLFMLREQRQELDTGQSMNQQLEHPLKGEHRQADLIQAAIAEFTRTTGLQAKIAEHEPRVMLNRRADAFVTVQLANGARVEFIVEAKMTPDRAVALAAAKQQLEPYADRGLLIAPYLTA